jgi:hypothetical protein
MKLDGNKVIWRKKEWMKVVRKGMKKHQNTVPPEP